MKDDRRTSRGSSFLGDLLGVFVGVGAGGGERFPGAGASFDGIGMRQTARPCATTTRTSFRVLRVRIY